MFELRRDDKKSLPEKRRSLPSQFNSAPQKVNNFCCCFLFVGKWFNWVS